MHHRILVVECIRVEKSYLLDNMNGVDLCQQLCPTNLVPSGATPADSDLRPNNTEMYWLGLISDTSDVMFNSEY